MKKPIMEKEDLDKEYIDVPFGQVCHVPLIQTTKLLGIKKGDLPTIQTPTIGLESNFRWLESEKKTKGLFIYNHHIEKTKDHLREDYPELKEKIWLEDRKQKAKSEEVCLFINSALILELNHMLDRLGDRPPYLDAFLSEERTLH